MPMGKRAVGRPGPEGGAVTVIVSDAEELTGATTASGGVEDRPGCRSADSPQPGTTPTRLPSESLNHAASPPPGIRAMPSSVRVSGVAYSTNHPPRPTNRSTAARTSVTGMTACVNSPDDLTRAG